MPKPRKSRAAAESKLTVVDIDKRCILNYDCHLKVETDHDPTVNINSTKFEKTSGEEKG